MPKTSAKKAPAKLSHVGRNSRARMVDVTDKVDSVREARASGRILISKAAMALVKKHSLEKGPVTAVARFAGIQAAKRTSDAIPMCHPLLLSQVDVAIFPRPFGFEITSIVKTRGQTGAEMEALHAVSVAALTIYDMVKAADKKMVIGEIRLDLKTGGKSGDFQR
ncbi:MAG: cyclic pyranopterin monophosphate synthase MoaC [Vicinamibacteria bacterium]